MNGWIEWRSNRRCIPVQTVSATSWSAVRKALSSTDARWLKSLNFKPEPGHTALLPDAKGQLQRVLVGIAEDDPMWALGALPFALPPGDYVLDDDRLPPLAALGWALGAYDFDRYRKSARAPARLALPRTQIEALRDRAEAVCMVRDLVNTPTADLGPTQMAERITALGKRHKARVRQWVGPQLLKHNFPTIHAVGRAASDAPRLIELRWGRRGDPKLTLVGKGVCFDTGGLNIKGGAGMRWMKKDMGGAAHVMALASLIMSAKLPVQLTLLVPAVDNAISGNAFRPGEVITTRAGISVEIDNTDAEGRLVLCDSLAYAVENKPDLLIDFATLTGAARVALGPDLPALFSNRDALAAQVVDAGKAESDPLWHMPLWAPYRPMLDSYLADSTNSANSKHAGAITAALYLQQFVPDTTDWLHVDTYAWNDAARPGRPRGGEALGLRAMFAMLQGRYG